MTINKLSEFHMNNRHTLWFVPTCIGMHDHNQQVPIHHGVCGQRITKYRAKKRECKAFSAKLKIAFDIDTSGDGVNILLHAL